MFKAFRKAVDFKMLRIVLDILLVLTLLTAFNHHFLMFQALGTPMILVGVLSVAAMTGLFARARVVHVILATVMLTGFALCVVAAGFCIVGLMFSMLGASPKIISDIGADFGMFSLLAFMSFIAGLGHLDATRTPRPANQPAQSSMVPTTSLGNVLSDALPLPLRARKIAFAAKSAFTLAIALPLFWLWFNHMATDPHPMLRACLLLPAAIAFIASIPLAIIALSMGAN